MNLGASSQVLEGKRIIITGCGYKPLEHIFYDITTNEPSHDAIFVEGTELKLNIGAATAAILANAGATVHMVSKSEDKLNNLKQILISETHNPDIEYSAVDLFDYEQIRKFVQKLPKDKTIYWVQSLGLGGGSYKVKDDNPYLHVKDISVELIEAEQKITPSTHILLQALLPYFEKQKETKIAAVSSMSAIRGYSRGAAHAGAKGGLDRYSNSVMFDLYEKNIFLTTIRPGAIDTGMYDSTVVQNAILDIDKEYGGNWNRNKIRLAPPSVVGEAIKYIFTTPAHIPSMNIVAKGQFPHEGS